MYSLAKVLHDYSYSYAEVVPLLCNSSINITFYGKIFCSEKWINSPSLFHQICFCNEFAKVSLHTVHTTHTHRRVIDSQHHQGLLDTPSNKDHPVAACNNNTVEEATVEPVQYNNVCTANLSCFHCYTICVCVFVCFSIWTTYITMSIIQ